MENAVPPTMKSKQGQKILITSPDAFRPRYDMFPEITFGEKLHAEGQCTVILATNRRKGDRWRETYRNIPTYRLPHLFYRQMRLGSLLLSFWWSAVLLLRTRPDLLFSNHLRAGSFPLVCWCRLFRIRVVLAEAGILHDDYLTPDRDNPLQAGLQPQNVKFKLRHVFSGYRLKRNLFNVLRHWPWYHADRVVFYSNHNIEFARAIGLRVDRLRTIDLYVDLTHIGQCAAEYDRLRFPGRKVVLLICQPKLRKGYDVFLEVGRRVAAQRRDVVFILATSSEPARNVERIRQFVSQHQLAESLYLFHDLSNDERNYLYRQADVFLMPSRYEGFGLPALEAGYNGAVVVASDVPALNEFLVNRKNALLFPVDDVAAATKQVMAALNLNPAERAALGAEMLATCRRFDIRQFQNFTEVFLSCVQ
jgi:glycosyltransferase involved in cell wall biosynthesis